MFKTETDAAQWATEHSKFFETVWDPKSKWTEEFFMGLRNKDMTHVFQGTACTSINGAMDHWKPMRGAFVKHTTLGVDIETHTDTMVAFTHYVLFKTFEDRDLFMKTRWIVDVDAKGKVVREVAVLDTKYWAAMGAVMGAYAEKTGVKTT